MSHARYSWKPSHQITIRCYWTQEGKAHIYDFKYTGELVDAVSYCYQEVLGARYPDFRIELREHRRV